MPSAGSYLPGLLRVALPHGRTGFRLLCAPPFCLYYIYRAEPPCLPHCATLAHLDAAALRYLAARCLYTAASAAGLPCAWMPPALPFARIYRKLPQPTTQHVLRACRATAGFLQHIAYATYARTCALAAQQRNLCSRACRDISGYARVYANAMVSACLPR